ncbi:hypothetical protein FNW10_06160 [Flavobacterium gawalongense]|uniref:hypothetical protein n=1 Tax=Flavobacterium gawalongense TaxID=2594432 RepID=UPI001182519E|nr:hypothetical protein [Flavobacterium gawalongense]TRX11702.1 hypothetical protein FNW10_06160 [Flavobacterium gawalongense]TRX29494.1 hypothetical protein FNW38_06255 [Flavobacterium gawalongense]
MLKLKKLANKLKKLANKIKNTYKKELQTPAKDVTKAIYKLLENNDILTEGVKENWTYSIPKINK